MPEKGDVLSGRYVLLEKIGSGGYGTVFRARDKTKNRIVAIKILRSDLADDPDYVRRFRREANIAGLLDSRHIVRVFEAGHARLGSQDVHFQVMEHVEGLTLQQLLKQRTQLAVPEALEIAAGAARALEEAHDKGVVHRDIKPKNIFIAEDETVKVGDFGIARAVDFPSLRPDDPILGTPRYMSPEQCLGKREEIDIRSDIYSLGGVLYEMIAGQPPFEGDSPSAITYKHIHETPAPLRQLVPSAPREVEDLVFRCLSKRPEDRFQSPRDLRRAIEDILCLEREAPEETTPVRPVAEPLAKRRPVLAGILALPSLIWRGACSVASGAVRRSATGLASLVRRGLLGAQAVAQLAVRGAGAGLWGLGRGAATLARIVWVGPSRGVGTLRRIKLPRPRAPAGWWTGRGFAFRLALAVAVLGLGGVGVVGGVIWARGGGEEGPAVIGLVSPTPSATPSRWAPAVAATNPLPPEASRIAYVAFSSIPQPGDSVDVPGDRINVVKPDGKSPIQIADDMDPTGQLAWSPTGDEIVFCTQGVGGALWLVGSDGTSPPTKVEGSSRCGNPAWSPDGEHIAFNAPLHGFMSDLWVVGRDGTGLRNLTGSSEDFNIEASWSPDSTELAFVKNPLPDSGNVGQSDLFVVDTESGGLTKLTDDESTETAPAWSPDGIEIAFSKDGAILAVNVASHQTREIVNKGTGPQWSPDGSRIAFVRSAALPEDPWKAELYVINKDGTGERKLTGNSGAVGSISWSPDGLQIAFVLKPEQDGPSRIYVVNADGSDLHSLTGEENERSSAWSPRLPVPYVSVRSLLRPEAKLEKLLYVNMDGSDEGQIVIQSSSTTSVCEGRADIQYLDIFGYDPEEEAWVKTFDASEPLDDGIVAIPHRLAEPGPDQSRLPEDSSECWSGMRVNVKDARLSGTQGNFLLMTVHPHTGASGCQVERAFVLASAQGRIGVPFRLVEALSPVEIEVEGDGLVVKTGVLLATDACAWRSATRLSHLAYDPSRDAFSETGNEVIPNCQEGRAELLDTKYDTRLSDLGLSDVSVMSVSSEPSTACGGTTTYVVPQDTLVLDAMGASTQIEVGDIVRVARFHEYGNRDEFSGLALVADEVTVLTRASTPASTPPPTALATAAPVPTLVPSPTAELNPAATPTPTPSPASEAHATPKELWTHQFGSLSHDYAYTVSSLSNGAVIAGFTDAALPGQTFLGVRDAFARRYDEEGAEIWTRQFGTAGWDEVFGSTNDANDSIYLVGLTNGILDGQSSSGGKDAFIRKYDNAGNIVWTRQFGTTADENAEAVSLHGANAYVVGRTFGTFPGEAGAGDSDAFVSKFDGDGDLIWTRQFGSPGEDVAFQVAADVDGAYVVGRVCGSLPDASSVGGCDAFVRRYDPAGAVVWTRQFGTNADDELMGISIAPDGAYVGGRTCGAFPGQVAIGGCDAFVAKMGLDGVITWARQLGSDQFDDLLEIATDGGGVYASGRTCGSLAGQTSAGDCDAYVVKYTDDGSQVWIRQFGTSSFDIGFSVAVRGGLVYVAGITNSALPGQVDADGSADLADAFLRVYGD